MLRVAEQKGRGIKKKRCAKQAVISACCSPDSHCETTESGPLSLSKADIKPTQADNVLLKPQNQIVIKSEKVQKLYNFMLFPEAPCLSGKQ